MIETKEKSIKESVYSVTQMTAIRALKMQSRLLKLAGPSFAAMIASGEDTSIPQALNLLTERLDEKTFENLVLDLLQGVRKDGEELTRSKIDFDFAGNLNELFLVLQFVLEVNFSDFFQEGGIIANLKMMSDQATPLSPELKKI